MSNSGSAHAHAGGRLGFWRAALLLSALHAFGGDAVAQRSGMVTGSVRTIEGAPVGQVQIYISGIGRGTLTDSLGRFTVTRIPAGRYVAHAHRIGFAPRSQEVDVATGAVTRIDLVLEQTPLTLPGIEVTAYGAGRDPLAVVQATAQLAGRDLKRELGPTLAATLSSQPGISVRSMGPAASMPVMRGLTGDRILVLRNGQRTGDLAGSADDHGVTIDPLSVERIEVIRGPATLLYGNNALGGVVNVISEDPQPSNADPVRVHVTAQAETVRRGLAGSVRATAPLPAGWSLNVHAVARSAGDLRIPRDPASGTRLENTDSRSRSGGAGITYASGAISGSASLGLYEFGYGLPVPPGADPVSLAGERTEASGRIEASFPFRLFRSVSLDASAQNYGHDEIDRVADEVTQSFALRTHTFNVMLRQRPSAVLGDGAWGLSALSKSYTATGPAALTPPADTRGLGIFTFQELHLPNGALALGARYDDYRITSADDDSFGEGRERAFPAFSGSIGLRMPLAEGLSSGVSISRSFRAPTVEELFSGAAHVGTGAVEFGNPGLQAERGTTIEAVLRGRNPRWSGQIAAYTSEITNYVYLTAVGDTLLDGVRYPVLTYTQDLARLLGLEGSIDWAATPEFVIGAIGDYIYAERADGTPLSYMPPARVGASARWERRGYHLGGDVHHAFRQNRVGDADERPTPAYTIVRVHAGVAVRVGGRHHSISLRAENLTNRSHREATSRIKDFAPGPGRNLAITYRIEI